MDGGPLPTPGVHPQGLYRDGGRSGRARRVQAEHRASERVRIASEATRALRAHTAIEEEIFYPAVRKGQDDLSDEALEGLEEHHVVEVLLDELEGMSSSNDERYVAKFTVVSELVEHHAEEEEDDMFPQVRSALGAERLQELGDKMQARHEQLMAEAETDAMTREELYERAKELDVEGRSEMSKRQLANALRAAY